MEEKICENFAEYVFTLESAPNTTFQPDFFQVYSDLQMINGRHGSEIFNSFLNKVFDKSEHEIDNILPQYLNDLCSLNMLRNIGVLEGMSRFLTILPNIIADYPKLTRQLANVFFVLYNLNTIKFDKFVINE